MNKLYNDCIFDILSRIPKFIDLYNCRNVCKKWKHIIDKYGLFYNIDDDDMNTDIHFYKLIISNEFVCNYPNVILPSFLIQHQQLPEYILMYYIDLYVDQNDIIYNISRYQILSEVLIEKYIHLLDLKSISYYQKLSNKFINKHANKLYWEDITSSQTLSENDIDKYINKYPHIFDKSNQYTKIWRNIFEKICFSDEFIIKHNINVSLLERIELLSPEFIIKNFTKFNIAVLYESSIIKKIEKYIDDDFIKQNICQILNPNILFKQLDISDNVMQWIDKNYILDEMEMNNYFGVFSGFHIFMTRQRPLIYKKIKIKSDGELI